MAIKNHIIKSFKVSEDAYSKFQNASEKTGLSNPELSRLLFNRALSELTTVAMKEGWDNLTFAIRELN